MNPNSGSMSPDPDNYLGKAGSHTTSNRDGWVPQLQEDYQAGVIPDAGDAAINAGGWQDDNPGQRKAIRGIGGYGDGYSAVLPQPGSSTGGSNIVGSGYMQTNAGNSFPKGSGPDAEAQDLRGVVLNEKPANTQIDYAGPKHGPLWVPRIREVNTLTPEQFGSNNKRNVPTAPVRMNKPGNVQPGAGVNGMGAKRTSRNSNPQD